MSPSETATPFSADSKAVYSCKEIESKIAAYLGLRSTTELRYFCFAWPFLRVLPKIKDHWKGLQRWKILMYIRYNAEDLVEWQITDPYFVPDQSDSRDQKVTKRIRCTAWYLLRLKRDFTAYKDSSDEENSQKAQKYLRSFLQAFFSGQKKIPECVSLERVTWLKPDIGPFEGETESECFNRLCGVLKMFESFANRPDKWMQRFRNEKALNSGKPVTEMDLPAWMRSKPHDDSESEDPLEGVYVTPKFNYLDLPFYVDQGSFRGAEELEQHLDNLFKQGRPVPPTKGVIPVDPEACPSGEVFRDAIRRHLGTSELGINLFSLRLGFVDHSLGDGASRQYLDVLADKWEEIRGSLQSPSNSNFLLRVIFKLQDDMPVFESDSLPPWLERK